MKVLLALAATTAASKDVWDKLSAVTALVSGVLVALIGAIATYLYNRRQAQHQERQSRQEMDLRRIEIARSFLPSLSSSDPHEKRGALLMISKVDPKLGVELGEAFPDKGSISALAGMALNADEATAEAARQGLEGSLDALRASVVQIGEPMRATGFVVRADGLIATTDYVVGDGVSEIDVRLPGGGEYRAKVLDDLLDGTGVALLKMEEGGLPPLPPLMLAEGPSSLSMLEDVVVMGATATGMKVCVGQVITTDHAPIPGLAVSSPISLAQLDIEPGQGGAPVVDPSGRVVGLVYGSMEDKPGAAAILLSIDPLARSLDKLDELDELAHGAGSARPSEPG